MGRPKGAKGKKKVRDPLKPKRYTSAYFHFLAFCREEAKRKGRSISKIAEFTKECSSRWQSMSEVDKKDFNAKAAVDKERYDKDMAKYKGKEEGKPKKPATAYFCFLAEFRQKMKGRDVDHKEVIKMAGEAWRNITAGEKVRFEKQAEQKQKEYEIAMIEWRKTRGAAGATAAAPPKQARMETNGTEDDEEDDEEDDDEYEDEEDDE